MHSDSITAPRPTMTAEEFEATLGGLVTEFASLPKVEHDPRMIDFEPPPQISQPLPPRSKWVLPAAAAACTVLGAGAAFGVFTYLSIAQPESLAPTAIAVDAKETKTKAAAPAVDPQEIAAATETKVAKVAAEEVAEPKAPADQTSPKLAAAVPAKKMVAKRKVAKRKARRRRVARHQRRAKRRRAISRRRRARRVASANDDWVDPFK